MCTSLNCTVLHSRSIFTVLESASYPVLLLLMSGDGGAAAGVCDGGGGGGGGGNGVAVPLPPFIARARFTCELFPSIF